MDRNLENVRFMVLIRSKKIIVSPLFYQSIDSTSTGCSFTSTDSGYVLDDLNRELDSFLLAVGVIAEHSITIGGNEYFLKDFFPVQTSLVFSIKKVPVLDYMIKQHL